MNRVYIKLRELCDLHNGFAFKSTDYVESSNVMNFRMSQIRPGGRIDLSHGVKYLPNNYPEIYSDYLLNDGDVVIAMTDMASDTKILGVPTQIKKPNKILLQNQRVGKLKDLNEDFVSFAYLRYILTSPQVYSYYKQFGKGGVQINLGKDDILNAIIPFCPLPEQHRIVAKIEELFSSLDKGIESLKRAQEQLKVYRQAVLKWAFEGKLTNSEHQIEVIPFGEVVTVVSGNTPKGLENISGKGKLQFYKVSDMNLEGNEVEMKTTKHFLTEEEAKQLKIKIYPKGTVIFPKRGGAILTNKKRILSRNASFDLNLMGALPNENVDGKYLFYWFMKLDLGKIYDGSSVPQINNKNIEPLEFQFCGLSVQLHIVSEIESRLSVCDKIEESITTILQQAEALRQSILKKAFEGKLVAQDPNDEPASVLLERIKAEREAFRLAQNKNKVVKKVRKQKLVNG